MSRERYNQIIDDAYKAYFSKTENITLETLHVPYQNTHLYGTISGAISNAKFRPYTKEEFINKCKTDLDFSQKWGLKIEERVLSTQERNEWYQIHRNGNNPLMKSDWKFFELDQQNIPTKLITLTYQNEKIESYE
jgi:hypothetical protein